MQVCQRFLEIFFFFFDCNFFPSTRRSISSYSYYCERYFSRSSLSVSRMCVRSPLLLLLFFITITHYYYHCCCCENECVEKCWLEGLSQISVVENKYFYVADRDAAAAATMLSRRRTLCCFLCFLVQYYAASGTAYGWPPDIDCFYPRMLVTLVIILFSTFLTNRSDCAECNDDNAILKYYVVTFLSVV